MSLLLLAGHIRLVTARASAARSTNARPQAIRRITVAAPRPSPRQFSVRAMSASNDYAAMVKDKVAQNKVMVFSKTYCPYCSEVKGLFQQLGVPAKVVELDDLADGSQVQEALSEVTGRRTVPQVFIDGQLVGGCDDTLAAHSSGKLSKLLEQAGVKA